MREYKIIKQEFSWTKANQKFEEQINDFARQGWSVVNVYNNGAHICALLEREKNR